MKLNKRGQKNVTGGTVTLVVAVIGIVILFAAAPELWAVLSDSLDALALADIPLVSGMAGIIGLLFGAVILVGGLVLMVRQIRSR